MSERDIAKRQTASVYPKELVNIGVLEEPQERRESLFVHPKLMRLMIRDDNKLNPYASS